VEERKIQSPRTAAFTLLLLNYRNTGRAAELQHRQGRGGRGETVFRWYGCLRLGVSVGERKDQSLRTGAFALLLPNYRTTELPNYRTTELPTLAAALQRKVKGGVDPIFQCLLSVIGDLFLALP
jgi:hypothetical protein